MTTAEKKLQKISILMQDVILKLFRFKRKRSELYRNLLCLKAQYWVQVPLRIAGIRL